MNQPLISIVIPVYNASSTIKMCADSVINQTYTNFEAILVNDGSKDDSDKKCLEYTNADPRFKYIQKQNGGLSDARNAGLAQISGDYVMFLDSDDALSPYALEYLVRTITQSGADIASFNFTFNEQDLYQKPEFKYNENDLITSNILTQYFIKEVAVTNRIFKKSLLQGLEFVKGQISEDVPYLFKCYKKASALYVTHYPFYFYNQSGTDSITRNGLCVKDYTAIEANLFVLDSCKKEGPDYVELAHAQYLRSLFNAINKQVLRGFRDDDAKDFYRPLFKKFRVELRKNVKTVLNAPSISKSDKIQIILAAFCPPAFKLLKKLYLRCK